MTDRTPQISTGISALNSVVNPIITESFAPAPAASVNPLQILIPVASWIWLAGAAVMTLYTAVSYIRLRLKVRTAVRLRGNIFRGWGISSPFVLGLVRPRIYLPFEMDEADMAHVIAHEQTHIRRRDHWWKPLGFLLLTVHWFNPLMWAAYILLCRDIELACDERVIKELGRDQRADYSQALLACSIDRKLIAACPLAFGEVGVKERVKNVLTYKKPAFWIIVVAVILCVVVAVCFLTNPDTPAMDVLPLLHSRSFSVGPAVYETEAGQSQHDFAVTETMDLLIRSGDGWSNQGELREMELTPDNFDRLFQDETAWTGEGSITDFRRDNANAWWLYNSPTVCYLLQQENGEVYLASGTTQILGLYRVYTADYPDVGAVAVSGENIAPVTIFPGGTAIGNFHDDVSWLTIRPYPDGSVPFTLFRDGYELLDGHYLAFDAETFDPLPYHSESGVPGQTYLFENADKGREYIVVAGFSTEADAELYCFGVRFSEAALEEMYIPQGAVQEWFDYFRRDTMTWETHKEIALSAFPDVTFRCNTGSLDAIAGNESLALFTGMPIWNIYFTDLTGDGYPEICATVSFGSGLIDTHVVVYDYAARQEYTLWQRGTYDYALRMENGKLICDEWVYPDGGLIRSGPLVLADHVGGEAKSLVILSTGRENRLTEGVYIPVECVYMNPLSSYYPANLSEDFRYIVTADSFITESHMLEGGSRTASVDWKWKDPLGISATPSVLVRSELVNALWDDYQYQEVGHNQYLIQADGGLYLLQAGDPQHELSSIWSIYRLLPESQAAP